MKNLDKLNDMVGNTYMYNKENITIKGVFVSETDQLVKIKTDRKEPLSISFLHIDDFVMKCKEIDSTGLLVPAQRSEVGTMKDILLDNIKKVQDNPAYINQAKAINNNINTLLNMVKLEIQLTKELNK